jgi:hypothetical protein
MPTELLEMMKVARKCAVELDSPMVENEVKRQMPLWHHIGATETL